MSTQHIAREINSVRICDRLELVAWSDGEMTLENGLSQDHITLIPAQQQQAKMPLVEMSDRDFIRSYQTALRYGPLERTDTAILDMFEVLASPREDDDDNGESWRYCVGNIVGALIGC